MSIIAKFYKSLFIQRRVKPSKVLFDVPYYSQFESLELVLKIINGEIKAEDDSLWKNSGAKDKEEYIFWSWRACGMTCLKMILDDMGKGQYPLVELARSCVKYGGYDPKRDDLGLIYKQFCIFVKKDFGIKAKVVKRLNIREIKRELGKGSYVIVSVHPDIRDRENPEPKRKGGHLVLVVGYDEDSKKLYINNPSGTYQISQKSYDLTEKEFEKFFAGRGVILRSNKKEKTA